MNKIALVDANVLLDIFTDDPEWREWSEAQLLEVAATHELSINPLIYAEVSLAYRTVAALDRSLDGLGLVRLPLPYDAGFLAVRAFLAYRQRGGLKTSPLPDFYIGAHAQVENLTLLTRDSARYRTYFPKLRLRCP